MREYLRAANTRRTMAEADAISRDVQTEIGDAETVDVIVGITTYNNAATVGELLEPAVDGILSRLAGWRAAIVNTDGGSKDGTPERIRELVGGRVPLVLAQYPVHPVHKLLTPATGAPGRGEALRTLFGLARKLNAKVCVAVDAGLLSMKPEWVDHLARPVLEKDFDLVTPWYQRHGFDGAINGAILYPLMRALYGKRIRQPIGGDMAFSAKLMDNCLEQDAWETERALGTELWIASQAIQGGFRVCQASLGTRILQTPEVAPDLSATLAQVLTAIFDRTERDVVFWQKVRGSEPVPAFGTRLELDEDPAKINAGKMMESFRLGYRDLLDIWGLILPPATLLEFKKLARLPDEEFRFPDTVWTRTVYDFFLGYHLRVIDRDHLLRAMTPIYLGFLASVVQEVQGASASGAEQRLERLCAVFEAQKRYLIARWRWPDRFNS
jgi:glycosyltransferase involved in cell wall biosynthesis